MLKKIKTVLWKCVSDVIYIPVFHILYRSKFKALKIASINQTIQKITTDKVSVSRYGDGEFKWMSMSRQESFEKNSKEMSKRLKEIVNSDKENHIVCLPQAFKESDTLTAHKYWEREMGLHGKVWLSFLDKKKQYYNTSITRPYIDFINKNNAKFVFDSFKKLWENKSVLIIEGNETKFGMGNDLLNSAENIIRIECPHTNAFSRYSKILKVSQNAINKYKPDIVLAALGPSATILSYDLSGYNGTQVLDIGHLDIEYEWFLSGATKRKAVPGKFVNEVSKNVDKKSLFDNKTYESQIIDNI